MILGNPRGSIRTDIVPAMTLDDLFRRTAARRPDAIALTDPPNRESFTDGAPCRLTYAEADSAISAIASRLRRLRLQADSVVGIQLSNTVESVLTILGVVRAGMIAAPLPPLWRSVDAAAALGAIGAKAIVTTSRIGEFDACATAMQVAAEVFTVRHVCSFGHNLPDGVMALDDLLQQPATDPPPQLAREGNPAAHVALVSFDVTPAGLIPVARNHAELIAGGRAALLEGGIEPDANLLACCAIGSFAGLALTVIPWLLSGGTLSLHHGFDAEAFATQCRDDRCDTIIVPGALAPQLADAGLLANAEVKNVLAVWRTPERLRASVAWQHPSARLTDMLVFGETAVVGSRRDADGLPVPLRAFAVMAPSGSDRGVPVVEIARTENGTLALLGPMVPRHPFPPGADQLGVPHLKPDSEGFVDTFYPCRLDWAQDTLEVTGPPPSVVTVGSYRFVMSELERLVRRTDGSAAVTALPDALAGHRLAGISGSGGVRAGLAELGVNPLIVDAFETGSPKAA
jgi:AMP-binding enzyme